MQLLMRTRERTREKCTCKWFVLVNFLEQKAMLPVPDVIWVVHPAFEHADRLA